MPYYRKKESKAIERGKNISVYLGKNTSNALMEWLNSQAEIGPTVHKILEQYVAGEFVHLTTIQKMLGDKGQSNISNNYHHSPHHEQEVSANRQGAVAPQPSPTTMSTRQSHDHRQERKHEKEPEEMFEENTSDKMYEDESAEETFVDTKRVEEYEEVDEFDPDDIIIEEDNPFEKKEKTQEEKPRRKMPPISPSWDMNR